MSRPRILDAYSCAGGAGMGYYKAGFDVVGIDIEDQPDYPFDFIQGDAVEYILEHGHEYDAIHASPPCQSQTALTKGTNKGREYPNLIPATREALDTVGRPYVIENVQGSEVRRDITLCGEMFGLGVIRHRYFELGYWTAMQPHHVPHRGRVAGWRHGEYFEGPYFAVYGLGGGKGSVEQWQTAMGIDWVSSRHHLAEAIPPAFSEWIGSRLIEQMEAAA